jgi:hypothetical protein
VEAGHGVRRLDPERLGAEEVHGAHRRLALRHLRDAGVEQLPPLGGIGGHQAGQPHAPHAAENGAGVGRPGSASSTTAPASSSIRAAPASAPRPPRRAAGRSQAAHQRHAQPGHAVLDAAPPIARLSGRQNGSRMSGCAMAESISAASRTVRAIGPATATPEKAPCGHCGTRP